MGRFYSSTTSAAMHGLLFDKPEESDNLSHKYVIQQWDYESVTTGSYLRRLNFLWYKQTVAKVTQGAIAKPSYN